MAVARANVVIGERVIGTLVLAYIDGQAPRIRTRDGRVVRLAEPYPDIAVGTLVRTTIVERIGERPQAYDCDELP